MQASETFPQRLPTTMEMFDQRTVRGLKYSFEHERNLQSWYSIVRNYNTLALTKAQDRLAALSGIAQRMRDLNTWLGCGRRPWSGICVGKWETADMTKCRRPRVYCAPSWSWASVTGTIYFDILARQEAGATKLELAEVLDVQIQPRGTDPTGFLERGFLRVRGPLTIAKLIFRRHEAFYPEQERDIYLRQGLRKNGVDLSAFGTADACLMDSLSPDLSPAPFDLASSIADTTKEGQSRRSPKSLHIWDATVRQ